MDALIYLLKFVFDATVMILVLRVWLQLVRADFYNPVSQFIVQVSNPIVIPARRIIPSFSKIDMPTIFLAYIAATLTYIIIPLIKGGSIPFTLSLFLGLIYLIKQTGMLIFFIMLIMALLSWVVQGYNPSQMVFHQLCEPLLRPIRRVVPLIAGLDLSVLVFFVAINVINKLLNGWVPYWASV